MISVPSFVNVRAEIYERETRARRYSEWCVRRRKNNRVQTVVFLLLGTFDFAVMFLLVYWYVFVG